MDIAGPGWCSRLVGPLWFSLNKQELSGLFWARAQESEVRWLTVLALQEHTL